MWAVFLLLLSYSDGHLAKGLELSALDGEKDISVSYALSASSCADTSTCLVGLSTSTQKADNGKTNRVTRATEESKYPASDLHALRRSKRGFTYPGTLWCGAGNIADNHDQLGEFAETDRCCRTHDFCPHVIHAFSSKYGFTNFKWHSISHCDCDNAMKECLRAVNDTSSRVVGQAFFNVIEVPCFEFSLEEQCVERHWYGVCKRYEKVPVAVIRESVPYDFGGIEVIDVLTIAPPKKKISDTDEGKQEEIQSIASGSKNLAPEEPSLTNVVTAAEDFIKVLATVSTSQSSSTDGGNTSETQATDKKRKKNAGKKKKDSKKRRRKGKGKKRKQNTDTVPKANGSVTGAPSAHRADDVISKNSFAEDSGNLDWVSKNDNFMKSPFTSVGDIEHTNKMMRDEHQRTPDEGQVSTTTAPDAKHAVKMLAPQMQIKDIELMQLFSSVAQTMTSKPATAIPRQRAAKKKQRHPTPTFLAIKGTSHNMMADNTAVSTTKSTSLAGLTTHTSISLSGEEVPHSVPESQHEKGSEFNATAQNTSIVGTKRLRSRQKGGRSKSQKSRKLYRSSSPSDSLTTEVPTVLLTDTNQELTAGPFPKPCSAPKQLQTKSPKSMPEKPTKHVSGEIKTIKCTGSKKRKTRRPKTESPITEDTVKPRQKASAVLVTSSTTGSTITDPAPQTKHAVESTRQSLSSRLQTITPSMLPLKTRTSKRRNQRKGMTRVEGESKAQKNCVYLLETKSMKQI